MKKKSNVRKNEDRLNIETTKYKRTGLIIKIEEEETYKNILLIEDLYRVFIDRIFYKLRKSLSYEEIYEIIRDINNMINSIELTNKNLNAHDVLSAAFSRVFNSLGRPCDARELEK